MRPDIPAVFTDNAVVDFSVVVVESGDDGSIAVYISVDGLPVPASSISVVFDDGSDFVLDNSVVDCSVVVKIPVVDVSVVGCSIAVVFDSVEEGSSRCI